MTIELTRELLERYLRATGWTSIKNEPWPIWSFSGGGSLFGDSDEYPWCPKLRNVARVSDTQVTEVAFRLGLCAAAEDDGLGGPIGKLITSRAHGLLRAAGIDPAAWEAAK